MREVQQIVRVRSIKDILNFYNILNFWSIWKILETYHHEFFFQETPFSNDSYPLALTYINWETDAIVGIELIRNVSMALGI